jgi:hypothetical protein
MMISLTYSRASSGRDLSMMIKFLSLVTNDEWRSLDEWAFQEGHSQLAKGATGFLYLFHSDKFAMVSICWSGQLSLASS